MTGSSRYRTTEFRAPAGLCHTVGHVRATSPSTPQEKTIYRIDLNEVMGPGALFPPGQLKKILGN
jgi:hypothetical protein